MNNPRQCIMHDNGLLLAIKFPSPLHALDYVKRTLNPDSCSLSADQREIRVRKGDRVWVRYLRPVALPGETLPDAERRWNSCGPKAASSSGAPER